jgi:hypothetical protein
MMKNVIRSVSNECPNLVEDELKLLYAIVKNEQLGRLSRISHDKQSLATIFSNPGERLDPSLPYYEHYKTDFDTFNALHSHLSLWGGSEGMVAIIRT